MRLALFLCLLAKVSVAQFPGIFNRSSGLGTGMLMKKDGDSVAVFMHMIKEGSTLEFRTLEGKRLFIREKKIRWVKLGNRYLENLTIDRHQSMLMTLAVDGQLRLFEKSISNAPYHSKYNGTGVHIPPTITYVIQRDSINYLIKEKYFVKLVPWIMKDQPDMAGMINAGEYQYEDLPELVSLYNKVLYSATQTITGKVLDAETREPVRNAKISIEGTEITTTTNALGFFEITVRRGDQLIIDSPDYELSRAQVPHADVFSILVRKVRGNGKR